MRQILIKSGIVSIVMKYRSPGYSVTERDTYNQVVTVHETTLLGRLSAFGPPAAGVRRRHQSRRCAHTQPRARLLLACPSLHSSRIERLPFWQNGNLAIRNGRRF